MTHKGIPDGSRAARLILKDYVNGKVLYCYPPPGYNSEEFQHYSTRFNLHDDSNIETTNEETASNETTSKVYFILFTKKKNYSFQQSRFQPSDVDRQFFQPVNIFNILFILFVCFLC